MSVTTPIATDVLAADIAGWAINAAPMAATVYTFPPGDRGALPAIDVLCTDANVMQTDPRWTRGHALLRVFEFEISLMVDPDPEDTATSLLYQLADALTWSVLEDKTLGGLVPAPGASSLVRFQTVPDPAILQLTDGTLVRRGTLSLAVGCWLPQAR